MTKQSHDGGTAMTINCTLYPACTLVSMERRTPFGTLIGNGIHVHVVSCRTKTKRGTDDRCGMWAWLATHCVGVAGLEII